MPAQKMAKVWMSDENRRRLMLIKAREGLKSVNEVLELLLAHYENKEEARMRQAERFIRTHPDLFFITLDEEGEPRIHFRSGIEQHIERFNEEEGSRITIFDIRTCLKRLYRSGKLTLKRGVYVVSGEEAGEEAEDEAGADSEAGEAVVEKAIFSPPPMCEPSFSASASPSFPETPLISQNPAPHPTRKKFIPKKRQEFIRKVIFGGGVNVREKV